MREFLSDLYIPPYYPVVSLLRTVRRAAGVSEPAARSRPRDEFGTTAMTRRQLGELIDELTAAPEVQASECSAHVAVTSGRQPRKLATMDLLGQLFGVTVMTIGRANPESLPPSPDPI
ncbi:hypothetical protein [Streptomyces sp. NPDC093269]|uniref:hypothetical protein n=1 Tax=Streptomyces sp. NPDC093269 TaxID=3366038 RepID=UPI00382AF0D9